MKYKLERVKRLADIFPKETKKVVQSYKKNQKDRNFLKSLSGLEEKAIRTNKAKLNPQGYKGQKPLLEKTSNNIMDKKAEKSIAEMDNNELMQRFDKHVNTHNQRMNKRIKTRNNAVNKRLAREVAEAGGVGALGGGALSGIVSGIVSRNPMAALKGAGIGAAAGGAGLAGLAYSNLAPKAKKYKIGDEQREQIKALMDARHNQTRQMLQKQSSENALKTEEDVQRLL